MSLEKLAALSNKYGSDASCVIAGGGNTSFKDEKFLYVKPSGIALATIKSDEFVALDRAVLRKIFTETFSADEKKREEEVKNFIASSVASCSCARPSVEAPLHELMSFAYVVHLHPALVNGLMCSVNAEKVCKELFPAALYIPYTDPGYVLAAVVAEGLKKYEAEKGRQPSLIFLQNHGVFAGADSIEEMTALYDNVFKTLEDAYAKAGIATTFAPEKADAETVRMFAPKLRTLLGTEEADGSLSRKFVIPAGIFTPAEGALTPDHIVYAKSFAFTKEAPCKDCINAFAAEKGYKPVVVNIPGKGVFCSGSTMKEAQTAVDIAVNGAQIVALAAAFGGVRFLNDRERSFIENWEVESYRKNALVKKNTGRLAGKVAVVTGAAQGFGYGIAEELAREDAIVVIADMNMEGAQSAADTIRAAYPASCAFAVAVNVSNEESVASMVQSVAEKCGGIDLFVANAGVVRAGSVKEMTLKDWEFVTDINYNGYFLCVKHVASLMSAETADGGDWLDIVQVNSKSGLQGSNRNGAYAGGKFGGIGLTQSFALELVSDRIKVNSVCPGNFFDGPLWSNPEKGLFVQYLKSGKVPGAKTVEDVKKFYESKIPMNRGCFPKDVAKAIIYSVEQKYETGQAIPVTGGQVMLK